MQRRVCDMSKRKRVTEEPSLDSSESPRRSGRVRNNDVQYHEANGNTSSATKKQKVTVSNRVLSRVAAPNTPTSARKLHKEEIKSEDEIEKSIDIDSPSRKATTQVKASKVEAKQTKDAKIETSGESPAKKVVRKRKTKEEKEAEAMPLAARTVGHKLYIGAHVSGSGGQITIHTSIRLCSSLSLYRRSQCSRQQCAYWSQCIRSLLEVAAQMGQSGIGR